MSATEGNSQFYFPENLNVSRDEVEGPLLGSLLFLILINDFKKKLFPEGTDIKCFVIYSDEQKFTNIHQHSYIHTIVFRDKNSIE
jgi:hypothetical protein